jgi:hypothetical protein
MITTQRRLSFRLERYRQELWNGSLVTRRAAVPLLASFYQRAIREPRSAMTSATR